MPKKAGARGFDVIVTSRKLTLLEGVPVARKTIAGNFGWVYEYIFTFKRIGQQLDGEHGVNSHLESRSLW